MASNLRLTSLNVKHLNVTEILGLMDNFLLVVAVLLVFHHSW